MAVESNSNYDVELDLDVLHEIFRPRTPEPHPDDADVEHVSPSTLPSVLLHLQHSDSDDENGRVEEGGYQVDEHNWPATIDDSSQLEGRDSFNRFWRYKKLQKGPKPDTLELVVATPVSPHSPILFVDPVFNKVNKQLLVTPGALRLGEGNDISPNHQKLLKLSTEISKLTERLSRKSYGTTRMRSRASSRLCRLRRSANHEANKIIFHGLEIERGELSGIIHKLRKAIFLLKPPVGFQNLQEFYSTETKRSFVRVAGQCSSYVDQVLNQTDLF